MNDPLFNPGAEFENLPDVAKTVQSSGDIDTLTNAMEDLLESDVRTLKDETEDMFAKGKKEKKTDLFGDEDDDETDAKMTAAIAKRQAKAKAAERARERDEDTNAEQAANEAREEREKRAAELAAAKKSGGRGAVASSRTDDTGGNRDDNVVVDDDDDSDGVPETLDGVFVPTGAAEYHTDEARAEKAKDDAGMNDLLDDVDASDSLADKEYKIKQSSISGTGGAAKKVGTGAVKKAVKSVLDDMDDDLFGDDLLGGGGGGGAGASDDLGALDINSYLASNSGGKSGGGLFD